MGLIITGTARSGTRYTSHAFKSLGFVIEHERMGRHGTADWLVPAWSDQAWTKRRRFPIVHQVREPLGTIASLSTIGRNAWSQIAKFVPEISKDRDLRDRMLAYVVWNDLAQSMAVYQYPVEELSAHIPKLVDIGGFPLPPKPRRWDFTVSLLDRNARPHDTLTWRDLDTSNQRLADQVRKRADRYGYPHD